MDAAKISLYKAIKTVNESPNHRVIVKYAKPEFYNLSGDIPKKIGVFLDIEATGLSYETDKLIELGMVKFEYSDDGRIFRVLEEFHGYQDPKVEISDFITQLTGINNDMVRDKAIDTDLVESYLKEVDLVVAHNATFDRAFFESTFPTIEPKAWACSMRDIDWNNEAIESFKLEYIAYKYNFFYEGHRAIIDCLVGIHILSKELYNSKELALSKLLKQATSLHYKIWAKNAPYKYKDLLRSRKYRWNTHPQDGFKAWAIELPENKAKEEIEFLKAEIYNNSFNIPIDIYDAYNRFSISNTNCAANTAKYADKKRLLNNL